MNIAAVALSCKMSEHETATAILMKIISKKITKNLL
mgnify:CR=1 FL=1